MARAPLYRVYQFFVALRASLPAWAGGPGDSMAAGEAAMLAAILTTPAQQRLFRLMRPNDRRHALAVARTLQQAGYQQPALLQAALLHDVAKSMGQPIIHRVLIVLAEAFWPAALRRLSAPDMAATSAGAGQPGPADWPDYRQIAWWRRPFVIHAAHPAIGAAWAAAAACDPLAVDMIARHQEAVSREPAGPAEKLLLALQWADNLN